MSGDPKAPKPDTKDWAWVLQEPCKECGFDPEDVDPVDLPVLIRDATALWPDVLSREEVRERPTPKTWSALEYGCHVRDVLAVFTKRVRLMLARDTPKLPSWDQDATARAAQYWMQDPATVAAEIAGAAATLAGIYAKVWGEEWDRPGRGSDGTVFTVATIGVYALHDLLHHLWDVRH
jgi:hypothetical protein